MKIKNKFTGGYDMSKYKVVLTDNIFPDLDLERSMLASVDAELLEAKDNDHMLKLIGFRI
jgi:hypothetical protein